MKAREPVPGFVHDHLDAFRVRGLDDGREVVAQPVVGAGGENDRLGVRVPADRGKDGLLRNRTVQAVLGVDRGIEINRVAAREHHAVVHRLVTVAVEQQLFAGGEQRLENDLVRGRGSVGRKEGAARAEGLGRNGLRLREEGIDDLVLVLLRDQNVDVELGSEARDALHELQRRHFLLGAFLIESVELVVDHDCLEIALLLDRSERFARRGDPGKRDAERIVERAGGRVQPFDEFLENERLVVDDEDPADRFFHGTVREYRIVASSRRGMPARGASHAWSRRSEKGRPSGPAPGAPYPAIAFNRTASRLLCRAASFLWMTVLSAMRSMIPVASLKVFRAAALSPAAIALVTLLIALVNAERRLALCLRRFSAWRAALRAPFVFAMSIPERKGAIVIGAAGPCKVFRP